MKRSAYICKWIVVSVFVALATSLSNAQPSNSAPQPAGLVSWWKAEGNGLDSVSGNTAFAALLPDGASFAPGEVGQAFQLDNPNAYLMAMASPSLNVGAGSGLTMEGWIKVASVSGLHPIAEWHGDTREDAGVQLWIDSNPFQNGALFGAVTDTNRGQHTLVSPEGILQPNVFQHVALTYDKASGLAALYLNGAVVAQANLGSFEPATAFDLWMGHRPLDVPGDWTYGTTLGGLLDELSIYNRALGSNEIAAIYNAGANGKSDHTNSSFAPLITHQPTNQTVTAGANATFTVAASGSPAPHFQWYGPGSAVIPGATTSTLTISNVQQANAGSYFVLVTNSFGSAQSSNAVLTVTGGGGGTNSCTPAPAGIVGWWPGEGNGADIINGNNAILESGVTFGPGKVGQAFQLLNYSNGWAHVPASPSLNVGAGAGLTVEGWINVASVDGFHPIVEWHGATRNDAGVQLWLNSTPWESGALFASVVDTNHNTHNVLSADGIVQPNVFQHVALTYDKASGVATIYLNGAIVGQSNVGSIVPLTADADLYFGHRPLDVDGDWTYGAILGGSLDEVAVYNRALTANEIAGIYNAGANGKCGGTNSGSGVAPAITGQPTNQTVAAGGNATFKVTATGAAPLHYQWYGPSETAIPGGTSSTLTLSNVQPANAGAYFVLVTNQLGFAVSSNAVLTVTGGISGSNSCTPAPSGLVALWKGENNALDSVGSNNGSAIGGSLSYAPGEVGSAFHYTDSSGYVSVPPSSSLDVGQGGGFTLEAWIQPADLQNEIPIFEWQYNTNSNVNGAHFWVSSINGPGCLFANIMESNGTPHWIYSAPGIVTADYQHVALTYTKSNGVAKIYRNGVEVASQNLGSFTPNTTGNLLLGERTYLNNEPQFHYVGGLDEMSVYNRALSQSEIAAIYNAGAGGKCEGTNSNAVGNGVVVPNYSISNQVYNPAGTLNQPLREQMVYGASQFPSHPILITEIRWRPDVNVGGPLSVIVSNLLVKLSTTTATADQLSTTFTQNPGADETVAFNGSASVSTAFTTLSNGTKAFDLSLHLQTPFMYDPSKGNLLVDIRNLYGCIPARPVANNIVNCTGQQDAVSRVFSVNPNATVAETADTGADVLQIVYTTATNSGTAPVITHQPTNDTVLAGGNAFFSVTATGSPTLHYQWYGPGSTLIPGATASTLTLSNVQPAKAGAYYVFVTNSFGFAQSSNAQLTVIGGAPVITRQPTNQTVAVGGTATFSVLISAPTTVALHAQWYGPNGALIPGATHSLLTLSNVQPSAAGAYFVVVTNVFGSATSSNAVLTVTGDGGGTNSCTPAPTGLVSWWKAEGNALDSADHNNGTLINGLGFATGKVGQAFLFTHTNQNVLIPASSNLDVGLGDGLTVEAWIKPSAITNYDPILEWNADDGINYWGPHLYVLPTGNGNGQLYANVQGVGDNWHQMWSAPGLVTPNTFQHVALTYDKASGVARLYLNGAIVVESNFGTFTPKTTGAVNIGNRPTDPAGSQFTFTGLIDEPSVYNRALAANEIAAIYNAGSNGKCDVTNSNPQGTAPLITSQPTNQTVAVGGNATFTVTATGSPAPQYQWYGPGSLVIPGAHASTLTLSNVQPAQAGAYFVLVTNSFGSVQSSNAVLTVTGGSGGGGTNSCTPAPSGIVSWWPGEGNGADIINGNNAILESGVTFAPGEVGQAFQLLNYSNGWAHVPASPSLNVGAGAGLTVEGWINVTSVDGFHPIVEWHGATRNDAGVQLWLNSTPWESGALFASVVDTNHNTHNVLSADGIVQPNVFQHVALTYDKASGVATIYLNGAIVGQSNVGSIVPLTADADLYFGHRPLDVDGDWTYGAILGGSLDEVAVYNRALTANEIAGIYNAGANGKCPTLPVVHALINPQPTVTMSVSGTSPVLSWPASATGYILQSADNLTPPINWTNVPGILTTNGGTIQMTLPEDGKYGYFRLYHP